MGVYVKGMEMPKNCGECLLAKLSPTGESLICNYMLSRVSWEERPFDCPLVPVPEHGRCIDADALKTMWDDEIARLLEKGIEYLDYHVDTLFSDFKNDVDKMPTIIPAEEGE